MHVLAAAVGLLAAVTAANLFILLGVIRRMRAMTTNSASLDLRPLDLGMPEIGLEIGGFTESTVAGDPVTDDDLRHGQALVVFLSASCQPCKQTVTALTQQRDSLPACTYVFVQAEPDEPALAPMLDSLNGVGAVIVSAEAPRQAFKVNAFPTVLLVDGGQVTFTSFELAEALPLVQPVVQPLSRSGTLTR
jgi:hypothetical protein